MGTFVIVHGAWGGGWEWAAVARALRGRGHEVFTPTLSGLGERAHVGHAEEIGLGTHVEDLLAVLRLENLRDVVLCAASYGGMPATGAADREPSRVRLLVYVDAIVPRDGEAAVDALPPWFAGLCEEAVAREGPSARVPLPPALVAALYDGLERVDVASYLARARDHPAAAFTEPLRLSGGLDSVTRAFVRSTGSDFSDVGGDPIAARAEQARRAGWPYREIAATHDPQLVDPEGTAAVLDELAGSLG